GRNSSRGSRSAGSAPWAGQNHEQERWTVEIPRRARNPAARRPNRSLIDRWSAAGRQLARAAPSIVADGGSVGEVEKQFPFALLDLPAEQLAGHAAGQGRGAEVDEREGVPGAPHGEEARGRVRGGASRFRGGGAQRLEDGM